MPSLKSQNPLAHGSGLWPAFTIALRRLFWSKFMWSNVILPGLPPLICLLIVINARNTTINNVHEIYEGLLRTAYLHFVIFFLANIFGFAVVRQETEDQTLHYLLLQPTPRWALFVGRFLAYLVLVSLCCVASLWLTYGILAAGTMDSKAIVADLFAHGRFVILLKESGVLVLGLAVYGAIAMLAGSFFKTAIYAIFLLAWESALQFIPQVLKEWTVLHYLHSLLPEQPQKMDRLFEILGAHATPFWSIAIVLGVTAVAMGLAMAVFHGRECQYADS
jgi:ABC-type transport system involved in multi-copper enzyme maturation permease subunit